ncbi:AAA domain-containing protein [Krasilnikovia cinnamomea]|uniref:AAA domain-containing protein n=1 Tax=Krasilnikovia cinnamomea TaxID=349313 RepID=A0A4Q7Z825_9ACTN|nr:ATP-binding protein [Krasilnikovia cinnamomea]RZU46672.1 AAA domain-containing protein [Krasilnikovia cinnamomea]
MLGAALPAEPLRAVVGNLAWTHDGSVWALWRVDPVPYRYATAEDKVSYGRSAATLLRALRGEPLLLSLCGRVGADDTARRTLAGIDAARHPVYTEISAAYRRLLSGTDLRERSYWLALPLPHGNTLTAAVGALAGAGSQFARSFGLAPSAPSLAEVRARSAQATKVTRAITGLTPATPDEVLWIHRRAPRRGTAGEPELAAARRQGRAEATWRGGRLRVPSYAALGEVHLDEGGRAAAAAGTRPAGRSSLLESGMRWLRDGGPATGGNPFSHRYVRITTPDAGVSHQAFLVLSDLPTEWLFPGGEWLAGLHEDVPFPVDWAIRATVLPGGEAKTKVGRKRRQLADQLGEYTPGENEDPGLTEDVPDWVLTGQQQLADEQASLDANQAEVEFQMSVVLGVWGANRTECEERAEALRLTFSDDLIAVRPTGDQIACYAAMLPGVPPPRVVDDYRQYLLADDLAKAMPLVGGRLGDRTGQVLGLTADGGLAEPVQLNIAGWTQRDISASLGLFAELGAGKSVTLKKILADVGAGGGRTIGWDRTRTQEQSVFLRAVFGDHAVQVVDLARPTAFSLDPLRVLAGLDGITAAETFVAQLLGVDATSETGTVLAEALASIAEDAKRSMSVLIQALAEDAERGSTAAGTLARQLSAAARRPVCAVIFDPDLPALDLTAAHIVFATHQMALPKRHELRSDLQAAKLPFAALFGRAVLTLSAQLAKTVAFGDPRFVLVHADECYWLTREGEGSPGYDTVLELIRDGRKNHAGILLAGHDPDDTGDDTLLGLLSATFIGRQRNRRLANRYVDALGVSDPDVRARLLRTITDDLSPLSHIDPASGDAVVQPGREGEFIAKIHQRLGRLRVLIPPMPRLQAAIRTTPDTETSRP